MRQFNYEMDYSRIKDLRIDNKLTQQDIAKYLNISTAAYSQFERMDTLIPIELLNKLANYYQVSLDYLLKITDDPSITILHEDLDKVQIGENLKKIRKDNKLYQETLAQEIGTSHSLISEYESGKKLISLTYGYAICRRYHVSLDYLYGKIKRS